VLEQFLQDGKALSLLAVMSFNLRHWYQSYPGLAQSAFFSDLLEQQGERSERRKSAFREQLQQCKGASERRAMVEQHLREQLAQVLHVAPNRIYTYTSMKSLGLDSLTALELRNRLETSLEITLPATIAWTYPTVSTLVEHLLATTGEDAALLPPPPDDVPILPVNDSFARTEDTEIDIAELSDQEIEARLRQRLEKSGY